MKGLRKLSAAARSSFNLPRSGLVQQSNVADAIFVALLHSRCSLCVTQKRNKKVTANRNVMIFEPEMNFISKLVLIFIGSNLLISCVPFPTKNTLVPNISGVLLSGGLGVSNIEVKLAYGVNDACSSDKYIAATTDDTGRFQFRSTHKWSMVRWAVPLDQIDYFSLCFVSLDGGNKWAYVTHLRTPSWAPNMNLTCSANDLFSQPKTIENPYDLRSTCKKEKS